MDFFFSLTCRGGYGFLFRSDFFLGQHELEYLNFFPEFNIRLYDKNSASDYYLFPPPKSEYFFQQHWESEYFFRKKNIPPHPPWKLNGPSLSNQISLLSKFLPCFSIAPLGILGIRYTAPLSSLFIQSLK